VGLHDATVEELFGDVFSADPCQEVISRTVRTALARLNRAVDYIPFLSSERAP
jgi:hypothetical protein